MYKSFRLTSTEDKRGLAPGVVWGSAPAFSALKYTRILCPVLRLLVGNFRLFPEQSEFVRVLYFFLLVIYLYGTSTVVFDS